MKAITPGHKYELAGFENPDDIQTLQFIQKEQAEGEHPLVRPVFKTVQDGTTNEEVLAMLIDRLNFLNKKLPSRETAIAITHVETALMWLNRRTEERRARGVEGTHNA